MKKLLIGGTALNILGSDRHTDDKDYLVNDTSTTDMFVCSEEVDLINANGHKFFKEVWDMESENATGIASPQALLELKAFSLVQHCLNQNWAKADACEYDIAFLVRSHGVSELKLVQNHITEGQLSEVLKIIKSVRI
jgi:hypothetical protein